MKRFWRPALTEVLFLFAGFALAVAGTNAVRGCVETEYHGESFETEYHLCPRCGERELYDSRVGEWICEKCTK